MCMFWFFIYYKGNLSFSSIQFLILFAAPLPKPVLTLKEAAISKFQGVNLLWFAVSILGTYLHFSVKQNQGSFFPRMQKLNKLTNLCHWIFSPFASLGIIKARDHYKYITGGDIETHPTIWTPWASEFSFSTDKYSTGLLLKVGVLKNSNLNW